MLLQFLLLLLLVMLLMLLILYILLILPLLKLLLLLLLMRQCPILLPLATPRQALPPPSPFFPIPSFPSPGAGGIPLETDQKRYSVDYKPETCLMIAR